MAAEARTQKPDLEGLVTTSGRHERHPRPREGECAAQGLEKPPGARHEFRSPGSDQLWTPLLELPL